MQLTSMKSFIKILCCVSIALETSSECGTELECEGGDLVLHVKAKSEGITNGVACETTLNAVITQQLDTLSQTQVEKVTSQRYSLIRRTTILRTETGYELNQETTENGQTYSKLVTYTKKSLESFISESANLILQRLIVRKGLPIPFETSALDTDNVPCMMSYISLGERNLTIANTEVTVFGIERVLHSKQNIPISWQSYFLSDGHLVLRVQVGAQITVKAKTIPQLFSHEEYMEESVPSKPAFDWKNDMQLYSKYLSRKDELKADYLLYLRNNPVVKDMLSDFIQALLMQKPDNTIEFAMEFFKSYSVHGLPTKVFLDSRV
ncbi:hypothetical protein FGIG_03013 [Fasciola gigantica]|uniref:Ciliogenesis-associated TTC17-interacting protein n=1 Tax=Fasciola gigantica TaxID=46835 RepID=A0A504YGW3_FASGI|nr:hypothetical protein FGIG_03013 [Fasciola gigantica]